MYLIHLFTILYSIIPRIQNTSDHNNHMNHMNHIDTTIFTFIYTEAIPQMCFSGKVFQEYLDSFQKNIHPMCDFSVTEITLLHVYSSINILHICSRTPFLESTYGDLLLYIVLNVEVRKSKHGSKYVGKKLFEIHFKIITTFSNFTRDFRSVAKYQFSEAVVVVDKMRKRGIYTSLVPELQS